MKDCRSAIYQADLSVIPSMRRLLNKDDEKKRDIFEIIENAVPVNNDS